MRSVLSVAVALAASLITVDAIKLDQRSSSPRVINLPIERRHVDNPVQRDQDRLERRRQQRKKRGDTLQVNLDNLNTLYVADASLGTPEQKVRLHIDTGSSDIWVNTPSSNFCSQRNGRNCKANGVYSANDSSTYQYINSLFDISYVDGSGATGDYATDTFRIGDATLNDLQFGIGYSSSTPEGIVGIGYPTNEASVVRGGAQPYQNLPVKLVSDGQVAAQAYSLWLNDLEASTGSILFGGIDTEKYHGTLKSLPILREDGEFREFIIMMTDMGYNGKPQSIFKNQKLPVLLDSGSSLTYLPNDVVALLYRATGAQYSASQGAAAVPCSLANSPVTIDFAFSGLEIKVQLNEMVVEVGTSGFDQPECVFGISPAGHSGSFVLGDTFLRSAYVVYDLEKNQISLAQTNFNSTESHIVAIQSDAGVPNAKGDANAATTTGTSSTSNAGSTSTPGAAVPLGASMGVAKALGAGIGAAWLASLLAV